jgi:hypothetical protein
MPGQHLNRWGIAGCNVYASGGKEESKIDFGPLVI